MSAPQFSILIRLPFVRGDFVDPSQADWNPAKDRALWKVISKTSKTSDLDWVDLANHFQVPPTFILQQAAWLYERHLEHVRAQMKKVGNANTTNTSGSGSSHAYVGGVPMRRAGSGGSAVSCAPSALSIRPKDSPPPRGDIVGAPAPSLSRTPSTNTITQSKAHFQQPQQAVVRVTHQPLSRTGTSGRKQLAQGTSSSAMDAEGNGEGSADNDDVESTSTSSSDSDSATEAPGHRSQLFKRPPRFRAQRPRESLIHSSRSYEIDETDRGDNGSLPFANIANSTATRIDNGPRGDPQSGVLGNRRLINPNNISPPIQTAGSRPGHALSSPPSANREKVFDASSSLTSSASDAPKASTTSSGLMGLNHRAELARISPKKRGLKGRREGSEGTPSMGSSFSDIDGRL
ncbi:hypothetical protein BCR34DRAFT_587871 [Clohesyomyces aquaticus]|uniref:Autophagy-related protein 29 n=1 Tax=Clohesyomyces aquaticus TaxID=1231657 RepID=A0A1Y1ZMQ7_9PLEO|nr:hypothetical protein BCR34DRAFT_587871 [Clohesyomyces aquaticus]